MPKGEIRPISQVWINRLIADGIPSDAIVVEVAPGEEPKVADALRVLSFAGTILLVEPDASVANRIEYLYKQILPNATVRLVAKTLQDVRAGLDIPRRIDTLVANHAFDDMVMSSILGHTAPRSEEPYTSITPAEYSRGIEATVLAWTAAIESLTPASFIASQYPVRLLARPGFELRQNSGFEVLDRLTTLLRDHASGSESEVGAKYQPDSRWRDDPRWRENPRWWLSARFRAYGT